MAENFTVRRLTIPELPILTELFSYKNVDDMVQKTAGFMQKGYCDIFVLFQEKELLGEIHVGYCSTDEEEAEPGRRAYLFAYRIKKGYHNRGLGTFLLRRTLRELEAQGYTEFTIGVEDDNESAKHIYNKLGFREVLGRRVGQDDEESDPYEYNLLLRRKVSCRDFIFVIGASGVGKSTLCRNLYGHYRTAYMEQSQAPEFESFTGEENVTGIEEEEICWQWLVSSLKSYHSMGFCNVVCSDLDDLRVRDIPEVFRGYDFIILRLICSDYKQNYEQMKNRGEGLIDFELLEKMSEKISDRPRMVNEYVIDVAGKTPEQVCEEAVNLIETVKICREYSYEKQPREMFYSWVFANGLR
jgi:ribosomal protein S18 acetylase RimI-like enzyme/energy-coupling factor transporter ATP-binding protein EcfA2